MKNIERKEGKRRTVGRFALEIRGIISIVGREKRILRPGARSTFNPLSRALSPFNVNWYASVNKYRYRGESAASISRGGKRFLNGRGRNEILICNFSLLLPFHSSVSVSGMSGRSPTIRRGIYFRGGVNIQNRGRV